MDLLLIVRDALASSLVGTLATAIGAREAGRRVGVLFTQEALAAVARGSFAWPRELSGQTMRLLMADRGPALGLPLLSKGEGRQLDARALVARAHGAGVELYACPIWTALLDLDGRLPDGLRALDRPGLVNLLHDAKQVVGSL
jgi:peroxiredoxin family protein